ncbi:MAG: AAC(3) family N-acetyltransferase [Clostridium sp.]|nr:AAC(3) family N-acetyltransferase [Clostridium sp.]
MQDYIPYEKIVDYLDVAEEDILFVGSDITLLGLSAHYNGEKFDPNKFIDSMIRKVGSGGTVLFPTYNWGFCKGETFDYKNTVSKTGSLSVEALKRKDFIRTKHPIYSYAVWGKDSEKLYNMDNISSFGDDSPFSYMRKNNAKMLIIGVPYDHSFTFMHHVEEMENVPYRYMKDFTAYYVDGCGKRSMRTYSMYVRNLEMGVITQFKLDEDMKKDGASLHYTINNVEFILIDLSRAYEVIRRDIINNGGRGLYGIEKAGE